MSSASASSIDPKEVEQFSRIAAEWWRHDRPERDYYVVEDHLGRRFWLFREGLYGGAVPPRWYVHGLFP